MKEEMDPKTLQALRASIRHWKEVCQTPSPEEIKIGCQNCALCNLFRKDDCQGCPVEFESRQPFCCGTPYDKVEVARIAWKYCVDKTRLKERFQIAAREELAFLQSLLPEGVEDVSA